MRTNYDRQLKKLNDEMVEMGSMIEGVIEKAIKALVNQSISSTLVRTINTSLTTFVMVLALFICGVSSLREFALALMVGVIGGAFSSVFLTGPLWYMMKTRIGSDVIKENQAASQAQPEKIAANPNRKKKKKKKRK